MNHTPMLICYDDSDGARRAIEVAAELLPGRRAVVLDVGPLLTPEQAYASLAAVVPEFEDLNLDDAAARARRGADRAREAGIPATARAAVGAPTWETILSIADEIDAGVIVIGSRGLSGVRERLEGSVSHEVSEHSHRPVLIVPPNGNTP
jgi:nucleotide-binding universal stress UspA family protein